MKILFVCTAAQQRSPTAVDLMKKFYPWHEAKFAGVHEFADVPVTEEAVKWADKIFAMQDMHKDVLLKKFPFEMNLRDKIIVLGIPDIYPRGDPVLVEMLKRMLKHYLIE